MDNMKYTVKMVFINERLIDQVALLNAQLEFLPERILTRHRMRFSMRNSRPHLEFVGGLATAAPESGSEGLRRNPEIARKLQRDHDSVVYKQGIQ
jgi:hypothetical protein